MRITRLYRLLKLITLLRSSRRYDAEVLVYRATVGRVREMSWWVLGYGDQVKVVKPVELADIVEQTAEKTLTLCETEHASDR